MGNTTSLYNNKNNNNSSEHYGADADFIKLSQSNALLGKLSINSNIVKKG